MEPLPKLAQARKWPAGFLALEGAAGTVAKTISAYDMTVSDSIYGKAVRYVSLERLREMLDHEYALLIERLHAARGDKTCFFAFANTAAAQSHSGTSDCHAWLGIRFQTVPHAPPSEVILHTRLLDPTAALQQEAIGRLGVNLCHATFYEGYSPSALTKTLLDDIGRQRLEIDWVKFSGPAFETDGKSTVDHRLLSLDLVRLGFTPAVLFGTDGSPLLASDAIRKQSVLVERGRFAPVTRLNLEMMTAARIAFTRDVLHHTASDSTREPKTSCGTLYEVMEITLRNLRDHGVVENADFLSRVDLLSALEKWCSFLIWVHFINWPNIFRSDPLKELESSWEYHFSKKLCSNITTAIWQVVFSKHLAGFLRGESHSMFNPPVTR